LTGCVRIGLVPGCTVSTVNVTLLPIAVRAGVASGVGCCACASHTDVSQAGAEPAAPNAAALNRLRRLIMRAPLAVCNHMNPAAVWRSMDVRVWHRTEVSRRPLCRRSRGLADSHDVTEPALMTPDLKHCVCEVMWYPLLYSNAGVECTLRVEY